MKKLILTLSFLVVVGCSSGSGNNPVAGTEPETTPSKQHYTVECIVNDPASGEYVTTAIYETESDIVINDFEEEQQLFCSTLNKYVYQSITTTCIEPEPNCIERRHDEIKGIVQSYLSLVKYYESVGIDDTYF